MSKESPKVLFFRRRRSQAENFLVFVEKGSEEYCCPFDDLESAMDFMEQEESNDLSVVCSLFQQLPMEEADD